MKTEMYLQYPDINGDKVVFVSEDDLWLYDLEKQFYAIKITSSAGRIVSPKFNSDGTKVAFSSNENGSFEAYILDLVTGKSEQITFLGSFTTVKSWNKDEVIVNSNFGTAERSNSMFSINSNGGEPTLLPYGRILDLQFGENDEKVIGRFYLDNARWKRYRGGQMGQIHVASDGENFSKLSLPEGNHVSPLIVNGKVYFLSDIDRISNLYSVNFDGSDLKQLTHEKEYFFRRASTDGKKIIMQKGGLITLFDIEKNESTDLDVLILSNREYQKNRMVSVEENFEQIAINKDDTHKLIIARGRPFYSGFWEEGTDQLGLPQGVRYRHPAFHPQENKLYMFSDEEMDDRIEIFDLDNPTAKREFISADLGIPFHTRMSPDGEYLAVFTNRFKLHLVNLKTKVSREIVKNTENNLISFRFSPDGKWLAFPEFDNLDGTKLMLYNIEKDEKHQITSGDFLDYHPRFSPDGKYLYFLSSRSYNPIFDTQRFDYVFPAADRIYSISLSADTSPPTKLSPKPLVDASPKKENSDNKNNEEDDKKKEDTEENKETKIDLDGIGNRISVLPIPVDRIFALEVTDNEIFYAVNPIKGMDANTGFFGPPEPTNKLHVFSLKSQESELVMSGITTFSISLSKKTLMVIKGNKLRLIPPTFTAKQENKEAGEKPGRKSMYIDLDKTKFVLDPVKEWKQMVNETWKLMKENYWEANMGGIDWEKMLEIYLALVPKIGSRQELSDLLWELVAETGTSHAYEIGGDYKSTPRNGPGFLGAEYSFDSGSGGYLIDKILKGDPWDENKGSPLLQGGVNLQKGDIILSVDGHIVDSSTSVRKLLVGKSGKFVNLNVKDAKTGKNRIVSVNTLPSEGILRYRDWVEENRANVHIQTNNKVGYIHIPDMGPHGVQEFNRYLKLESQYDALIIDVRYNAGGHTSQLFLEKLMRKRLGYDVTRHGTKIQPYFDYTIPGPMLAITNEHAGSDGDIFSHSFKMLNLGKLIGTRTWGGVVGIWPKISLVDGTIVTQPELSYYFTDVGYDVENYGTDPDIVVDYLPNDYMKGVDPQLDKAIELINKDLVDNPVVLPDFTKVPKKI